MFLCLILLFLTLHCHVESNDVFSDPNNFGPFYVTIEEFKACKGPKSVDAATFGTNLTKVGNSSIGSLDVTILADTWLDEARIYIYTFNDNVKKILFNRRSKTPCQNFVTAGIVQKCFLSSTCFLKKGSYGTHFNFTEITSFFYGPKFFYGTYIAKTYLLSKKGNIFCSVTNSTIRKL